MARWQTRLAAPGRPRSTTSSRASTSGVAHDAPRCVVRQLHPGQPQRQHRRIVTRRGGHVDVHRNTTEVETAGDRGAVQAQFRGEPDPPTRAPEHQRIDGRGAAAAHMEERGRYRKRQLGRDRAPLTAAAVAGGTPTCTHR